MTYTPSTHLQDSTRSSTEIGQVLSVRLFVIALACPKVVRLYRTYLRIRTVVQAPSQPLDGATGYFTGPALFPLYPNVLLVCPMSGWLQTYVNKPATAQCGRYVLISFPSN
jgi:hypothetical protein